MKAGVFWATYSSRPSVRYTQPTLRSLGPLFQEDPNCLGCGGKMVRGARGFWVCERDDGAGGHGVTEHADSVEALR